MKATKVKNVQPNETFEGQFGLLYKFKYEFEDGIVLDANHKTADGFFKPGTAVEYEITGENNYGKRGKVKLPQLEGAQGYAPKGGTTPNNAGGNNDAILYQVALKAATEIYAAKSMVMPTEVELTQYAMEVAVLSKKHIEILKTL